MSTITIEDIERAIMSVTSPSVREQSSKTIKQVFTYACEHNYMKFNPAIAAIQNLKKELPSKGRRDVTPFTIGQIKLLLYTCMNNFPDMYMPLLLSLTLGTRISETIALQYSDVDFTSGAVYVRRQLGKDLYSESEQMSSTTPLPPKTQSGIRCIPAPTWVIDEIAVKKAWYERQKDFVSDFDDQGYICCRCTGKPFQRGHFGKDFAALLSMCGLPQIHWHDLRHIYASVLKNNSVNMKAVSEFLGHHSPDFTEDVYVHHEEASYDCSMLENVWKSCRPNKEEKALDIPLSEENYRNLLCK